jgi:PEP-CTERM motif
MSRSGADDARWALGEKMMQINGLSLADLAGTRIARCVSKCRAGFARGFSPSTPGLPCRRSTKVNSPMSAKPTSKSRGARALSGIAASIGAFLAIAAVPASATVVSGSVSTAGAVFQKLTVPLSNPFGAPNSVGNDTFQSPNLYAFDEDQNILLAAALSVDVGVSPIAAGLTVASHYVFFDPTSGAIDGTVNFDSDVLGIMTSTGLMATSDFLANTGVNYLNPVARGLEAGDFATISGTRQIRLIAFASTPGDYIRVITAFSPGAVPEPGTLALIGTALAAACMARRRRA